MFKTAVPVCAQSSWLFSPAFEVRNPYDGAIMRHLPWGKGDTTLIYSQHIYMNVKNMYRKASKSAEDLSRQNGKKSRIPCHFEPPVSGLIPHMNLEHDSLWQNLLFITVGRALVAVLLQKSNDGYSMVLNEVKWR